MQRQTVIRVVVFLRLIIAKLTNSCGCFGKSVSFNGMVQSRRSFIFLWMTLSVCFSYSRSFSLKFLCMLVLFIIFVKTSFAPTKSTVIRRFISMKLRNVFDFLAFTTGFGYDGFRHFFFLTKKLCLGLRQVHPCLCLSILSSQANLSTSFWRNFQWQ